MWVFVEFAKIDEVVAAAASFAVGTRCITYLPDHGFSAAPPEARRKDTVLRGERRHGPCDHGSAVRRITRWTSMHYLFACGLASIVAGSIIFVLNESSISRESSGACGPRSPPPRFADRTGGFGSALALLDERPFFRGCRGHQPSSFADPRICRWHSTGLSSSIRGESGSPRLAAGECDGIECAVLLAKSLRGTGCCF